MVGPYHQGELDSLCGVYAAVNALALLTAQAKPLGKRRCLRLLRHGLAALAASGSVEHALTNGIEPELWFTVVAALTRERSDELSFPVVAERMFEPAAQPPFAQVRDAIDTALGHDAVVLLLLDGAHRHYTVVAAQTPDRWSLYDSAGLRWLPKAKCGTERSKQRHRIVTSAIMTLRVLS